MDAAEAESIIANLPSKAAKVRALTIAGMPTADIGRLMNISYQQVYNAQSRPLKTAAARATADAAFKILVSPDGTAFIPREIIAHLGVRPGDEIFVVRDGESLELLSKKAAIGRLHEHLHSERPQLSALLDGLIPIS